MEQLYDRTFTVEEMEQYLEMVRVPMDAVRNSRDVVVSQVGEELYELFFHNYTKKQWGVYPEELAAEVTRRLPVRFNRDTRYFSDTYQGIPTHGYTRMFERMLDHPNIELLLNTDYRDVLGEISCKGVIYTGPIDEFFDYRYGKLPYRSLRFDFVHLNVPQFQNAAVVNYPNDHDYTRITESKQFYFQQSPGTTICYEYPQNDGDPYYPMPMEESRELYRLYSEEAQKLHNVHFVGRLAEYRYMNMDQVVERGLELFRKIAEGELDL